MGNKQFKYPLVSFFDCDHFMAFSLPYGDGGGWLTWGVLILLFFLQNFSEHQILWSLCSVVFHALTLKFKLHFLLHLNSKFVYVQVKTVKNSGKQAHPYRAKLFSILWSFFLKFKQTNMVGTPESGILDLPLRSLTQCREALSLTLLHAIADPGCY